MDSQRICFLCQHHYPPSTDLPISSNSPKMKPQVEKCLFLTIVVRSLHNVKFKMGFPVRWVLLMESGCVIECFVCRSEDEMVSMIHIR